MSDRRSFSEIPAELLRDQGQSERVERVWRRLRSDLTDVRRRRRAPTLIALAALAAAAMFALGVIVGARWLRRDPMPLTMLGAEPSELSRPAALPAQAAQTSSETAHDAPRSPQGHHVVSARRVESVTEEEVPGVAPPVAGPATPAPWQQLADEGQYSEAFAALEANGGFDSALRDATAEQLMSLVDVARATGQRQRAVFALRRIVSEHGSDPNAPVAAWMLGNELFKVRDLAGAEQAFAMYRALSPNGDFAEDALARQIDMAAEQANLDHARRLAEQYMKEFPDGPRTADIQAELVRWTHAPSASLAPAEPALVPRVMVDAGVPR